MFLGNTRPNKCWAGTLLAGCCTLRSWNSALCCYVDGEASVPVTAASVVASSRPSTACVATVATSCCCYCYEPQPVHFKLVMLLMMQLLLLLQACLVVEVQVSAADCPVSSSIQCMCTSWPSTADCATPHAELFRFVRLLLA
jgi:hypothetical protein